MGFKKLFTDMIKQTYTMYSEIINLQKIIIKIGETLDGFGLVSDTENETLKVTKNLKVDGHILNKNETFGVDENGDVTANEVYVEDKVSFSDGTSMDTAPHLYRVNFRFDGDTTDEGVLRFYGTTYVNHPINISIDKSSSDEALNEFIELVMGGSILNDYVANTAGFSRPARITGGDASGDTFYFELNNFQSKGYDDYSLDVEIDKSYGFIGEAFSTKIF